MTVDCLTKEWNNKVTVSSGEAVTHNFVDAALRVHTHVLAHDIVREQILLAPLPIRKSSVGFVFLFCAPGRRTLRKEDAVGLDPQAGHSPTKGQ